MQPYLRTMKSWGNYFSEGTSLADQWEDLSQNLSAISDFVINAPSEKEFKAYIKSDFAEYNAQVEDYAKGLKTLKDDANNLVMQQKMGHRHRTRYLEEIRDDMSHDSRLVKVAEALGGLDRLWRLIGNISNLQLRAQRWYFNAPEMMKGDRWEPQKLQKTLIRAFKYFHPSKEQSVQYKKLIEELSQATDVIDALCTIDPIRTIPPYEDQNNRHPPVDQTLWLSPQTLNTRYGQKWLAWANHFLSNDPELGNDLDKILDYTDRKSRITALGGKPLNIHYYRASYILQRVLDRTRERDVFALRAICRNVKSNSITIARTELERVLGKQHIEQFLSFAADYYEETSNAKSGLWITGENTLLERSDIHPPMKSKVLNMLVGNVFGESEHFGLKFIEQYWNRKVTGRSSVRSICMAIENTRKVMGGEFNIAYQQALRNKELGRTPLAEEKDLLQIASRVDQLCNFFADNLKFSDVAVRRISNPYSLAQLYTLIETERAGFTSTTIAAHKENAWRMGHGQGATAQCSRLPADAVRPFDGVLRRVLDQQAWELTKLASQEIRQSIKDKNATVDVSILVEQNKFAFSASIAEIKKNDASFKKASTAIEHQKKHWADKDTRIKEASCGLCPYTGAKLPADGFGEIDHIIPRSRTTAAMGTIFNSEANLIFVTQEGNQIKGTKSYYLENLATNYLEKRFGTSDLGTIEKQIEDCVTMLVNNGRIRHFDMLNDHEQACVRHALFLREFSQARQAIERELAATNRTRVNGTQAWLVKTFLKKLQKELTPWRKETGNSLNFRCWATDVLVSSRIRDSLGNIDSSFKKIQPQPIASHSIDAMCVYATACSIEQYNSFLNGDPDLGDVEHTEKLLKLYPDSCDILRMEALNDSQKKDLGSRAIFKEGILAENFVPIMLHKSIVRLGFGLPTIDHQTGNCFEVKGKDPLALLRLLAPYLDREVDFNSDKLETYRINKQAAFTLFSEISRRPAINEELAIASILESMHYVTERKKIFDQLTKDGKFQKQKEILKDSNFVITIHQPKKQKLFKMGGKLILPSKTEWSAVCNHESITPLLGNKIEAKDANNVRMILDSLYRTNSSKRKHVPVRHDPSLPICATASGLFRIKRRTPDKTSIYQTHNINISRYAGFATDKEKADWNTPVTHLELVNKNVTGFEARYNEAEELVSMQSWRLVQDEDLKVYMAPGSDRRRYIRIDASFNDFRKWYEAAVGESLEKPFLANETFKVDKTKFCNAVGEKLFKLIGFPRTKALIESLGKRVVFRYTVDSSNTEMKNAYNR